MKISLIKVLQNALIGGYNGHMAFIYNNQFIRELFDSFNYEHKDKSLNYEDEKFKAFLYEILKERK